MVPAAAIAVHRVRISPSIIPPLFSHEYRLAFNRMGAGQSPANAAIPSPWCPSGCPDDMTATWQEKFSSTPAGQLSPSVGRSGRSRQPPTSAVCALYGHVTVAAAQSGRRHCTERRRHQTLLQTTYSRPNLPWLPSINCPTAFTITLASSSEIILSSCMTGSRFCQRAE